VNNTNPAATPGTTAHDTVAAAGAEIGEDGQTFTI
jgi:hypothetical protein